MNVASPLHHKTLAIIQARMGSSRLPGKVLLDVSGTPMLARVVERARLARRLDDVIVATTTDPSDDPVATFCLERGYHFFRGSLHDVLDRYYGAACEFGAEAVVRLTGDCPLVDPEVIDQTILGLEQGYEGPIELAGPSGLARPFDFSCNRLPPPWKRTYPMGLDVEVSSFSALERAWKEADQPYHREHVMPYLYEGVRSEHYILTLGTDTVWKPRRLETASAKVSNPFRVLILDHSPDYGALRWTVDTPEDLLYVSQILDRFTGRQDFRWLEVIDLLEREAELALNNPVTRPKDYREFDHRSMK